MSIEGALQARVFRTQFPDNVNTEYLLYLPVGYEEQSARRWPFILFLHGRGECGTDLHLVSTEGLAKKLQTQTDFPFLTVAPQCLPGKNWDAEMLNTLLDELLDSYRIDRERVYLTGLSMGGFGTWALAIAHPERFAAIAPICGGGDPARVCVLKDMPVWNFHGGRDSVVPIARSNEVVNALQACGGDVRFTVYPEAGHDSWTETYSNPQLYEWFLSHTQADTR